jgi:hypothetical protein
MKTSIVIAFMVSLSSLAYADLPAKTEESVCLKASAGKNSDGDSVMICEQTFPEIPYIRPAKDDISNPSAARLTVGIRNGNLYRGLTLIDRSGQEYLWLDSKGKQVQVESLKKKFPKIKMPSHRNQYLLYLVTGKVVENPLPDQPLFKKGIQVTNIIPEIMITGCAIDSRSLGIWEGSATLYSPKGGQVLFDSSKLAPVQIEFSRIDPMEGPLGELAVWDGSGKTLPDGKVNRISGRITNWDQTVSSEIDGSSMAPLSGYGTSSPFSGDLAKLTPNVQMYRTAAMHVAQDAPTVFLYPGYDKGAHPDHLPGSGMEGEQLAMTAAALMQTSDAYTPGDVTENLHVLKIYPHGPFNGHFLKIHFVKQDGVETDCH